MEWSLPAAPDNRLYERDTLFLYRCNGPMLYVTFIKTKAEDQRKRKMLSLKMKFLAAVLFGAVIMTGTVTAGYAQDPHAQIALWQKAADQGDAKAQLSLGDAYHKGEGVKQDDKEALNWYRKAADLGNDDAQYKLGSAYFFGHGIAQDSKEGIKWFRKAAEQGNADAQFNLGGAYLHGNGVDKDEKEALFWWRKAAEQGDSQAQGFLDKYAK